MFKKNKTRFFVAISAIVFTFIYCVYVAISTKGVLALAITKDVAPITVDHKSINPKTPVDPKTSPTVHDAIEKIKIHKREAPGEESNSPAPESKLSTEIDAENVVMKLNANAVSENIMMIASDLTNEAEVVSYYYIENSKQLSMRNQTTLWSISEDANMSTKHHYMEAYDRSAIVSTKNFIPPIEFITRNTSNTVKRQDTVSLLYFEMEFVTTSNLFRGQFSNEKSYNTTQASVSDTILHHDSTALFTAGLDDNEVDMNMTTNYREPTTATVQISNPTLPTIFYVSVDIEKITNSGIGLFSLITNGLSLLVFLLLYMKKERIMIVFVGISIVDTFSLTDQFAYACRNLLHFSGQSTAAGCLITEWFKLSSQMCSSYLILMYTIERFVCVRWPMLLKQMFTKTRIYSAMIAVVSVSLLTQSYVFIWYETSFCYALPTETLLEFALNMVVGQMAPYLAIAVLNSLTILTIIKERIERAKMMAKPAHHGAHGGKDNGEHAISRSGAKKKSSKTAMLILASSFSLIVSIPKFISKILTISAVNNSYFLLWAEYIIGPWNYCGSFFFYILGGKKFRHQLIRIVTCGRFGVVEEGTTGAPLQILSAVERANIVRRQARLAAESADTYADIKAVESEANETAEERVESGVLTTKTTAV